MINDQQEQLARTKEMYQKIRNRIEEIEMEQKRAPRIDVAYRASSVLARGKRRKLAAACGFGGLVLGAFLAFLIDRADKRLHSPDDIVKRVGVRIIGTTTNPKYIDEKFLNQQLVDDYQTIRANLGLLNGDGSSKVIVVTSPGTGDGKTTFAINLTLSFAQSGERVLLIDGDFRKPDVARMLNLVNGHNGLEEVLLGKTFKTNEYRSGTTSFDILSASERNSSDTFNLLNKRCTSDFMNEISHNYDRVLIDTLLFWPLRMPCSGRGYRME